MSKKLHISDIPKDVEFAAWTVSIDADLLYTVTSTVSMLTPLAKTIVENKDYSKLGEIRIDYTAKADKDYAYTTDEILNRDVYGFGTRTYCDRGLLLIAGSARSNYVDITLRNTELTQGQKPIYALHENKLYEVDCDNRYADAVFLYEETKILNRVVSTYDEEKALPLTVAHTLSPLSGVVVFLQHQKYLHNFIGYVSGDCYSPYNYKTPHGFTICIGLIYGQMIIHTIPDKRFYLSGQWDYTGKPIGVHYRTQAMPLAETPSQEFEVAVNSLLYDTPCFQLCYSPLESGKPILVTDYRLHKEVVVGMMTNYLLVELTSIVTEFIPL